MTSWFELPLSGHPIANEINRINESIGLDPLEKGGAPPLHITLLVVDEGKGKKGLTKEDAALFKKTCAVASTEFIKMMEQPLVIERPNEINITPRGVVKMEIQAPQIEFLQKYLRTACENEMPGYSFNFVKPHVTISYKGDPWEHGDKLAAVNKKLAQDPLDYSNVKIEEACCILSGFQRSVLKL